MYRPILLRKGYIFMNKKLWDEQKQEKKVQKVVDKYWKVAIKNANNNLNREQRRKLSRASHARG